VEARPADDITNNSGATIQATGPFGQIGILVGQMGATGPATVHNAGMISGPEDGINTNITGTTTITNSGSITATTRSGIRVNTASVENDNGGAISGLNGIFFRDSNGASSVFNDGTITGTGGTAIHFSGGSTGNTLTLGVNSTINGNVLGAGSDEFQLGGTGSGTFDVSNIGASQQYQGFSIFDKVNSSNWTLTGTGTQNWTINLGTLTGDTSSLGGSSITDNAALVFDQAFNGTHPGP